MSDQTQSPKHTPGPWFVRHNNPNDRPLEAADFSVESFTWVVAEVYSDIGDLEEAEANARLIAAAPKMKAFLVKQRAEVVCVCGLNKIAAPLGAGIDCTACELDALIAEAEAN